MVERVVTIPWDRPPADIQFRAVNDLGPGPASVPVRAQALVGTNQRQIYLNGEWVTVDDYVVARAIEALRTSVRHTEFGTEVTAESITDLAVQIGRRAAASALQALQVRVVETEGGLSSQALQITELMAEIAGGATTQALQQLIARVTETENETSANAAEIVALEAAHGGRTLGPAQNIFDGEDKAAAAAVRDAYAMANPGWLADYDADNDINIELRWGVLYIYQRRVGGAWLDNGEALARAAAVTDLNTRVVQQGTSLTSVSEMLTGLVANIGEFTAAAFQELSVRVTQTENVEGGTDLAQLARWLGEAASQRPRWWRGPLQRREHHEVRCRGRQLHCAAAGIYRRRRWARPVRDHQWPGLSEFSGRARCFDRHCEDRRRFPE